MTAFQTKTDLRGMLEDAGISPLKRYGQNFLIDQNLMRKLVDSAELTDEDCVLEVGAGTGSLTSMLARAAGRVVAVEIDRGLARLAAERLSPLRNVDLITVDALDNKSTVSRELEGALRQAGGRPDGPLKMVANLPYDIATPLVMNLLLGDLPFRRLCFTVQAEVADRFLAAPGTPAYGPVGIVTQLLATGRRVCRVPPQAFWPAPKVRSTMLRLDVREPSTIPIADPSEFSRFVRSFFQHRRKTITHIARRMEGAEQLLAAIDRIGLSPDARSETLSLQRWVEFYLAKG
jgi:16S rRNA (adenine1518-N6/adenine1519-N6)-dimethyltransferase